MSYWRYWKLNSSPFAADGESRLVRDGSVEEALARIEFLVEERRSLAMLVGPSGVGKSTLLKHLVTHPPRIAEQPCPQVCLLSLMGLAPGEIPCRITQKLVGRPVAGSELAWKLLSDHLRSTDRSQNRLLVLFDDAESCSIENEQDLIRLATCMADARATMLLASEIHLTSAVSDWLQARSSLQIELPRWNAKDVDHFLRARLLQCGARQTVFAETAVLRLCEASAGIPRRIVQLADLALISGAAQRAAQINDAIIAQVARELPHQAAA